MPFVGKEFTSDVLPVNLRFTLHILLTAAAVDGDHVLHPEVIGVSPDGVNGLFEAHFNFEPPAIEGNDLQRVEGQIGAQQDQIAAGWVTHPDKAYQLTQRAPEQVLTIIAEGNVRFSVDWTGGLDELLAVTEPLPQEGLETIDS